MDEGSAFLTGGAGVFGLIQDELDNTYLLTILNSKLMEYFLHSISTKKQNGYYSYLHTFLSQIPIIKLDESDQLPFIKKGERLTSNIREIQSKLNKFRSRVLERFPSHPLHRKLSKFYELDFSTLINIIYKRSSHRLSLNEADEWQDYFNTHKYAILLLIDENRRLVAELDSMVFDLYGLTEEQRNIIVRSLESE